MTNSNPESCRQAEEWLNLRLDGELSSAHALDLDRHLGDCPHCRRELKMASGLEKLFACLELPAAEEAKQMARRRASELVLRSGPRVLQIPKPKAVVSIWRKPWTAAALAGLVALAGAYAWFSRAPGHRDEASVALANRFTSRAEFYS